MDLNARVDVNCGWIDGLTDGRKTGRLYRTLLKQVRQKWTKPHEEGPQGCATSNSKSRILPS